MSVGRDDGQHALLRALLIAIPALAGLARGTPHPVWLGVGAVALIAASVSSGARRGAAVGVAAASIAGPALELPVAWIPLVLAAALAPDRRRLGAIAAIGGLGLGATWGIGPGDIPVAQVLAAIAVGAAVPWTIRGPIAALALAEIGAIGLGVAAWRATAAAEDIDAPAVAERWGAAWLASSVQDRLDAVGLFEADARQRDRARTIGELGAPRLALTAMGLEPIQAWERGALLGAAGNRLAMRVLPMVAPPKDAVRGPGVVWERDRWSDPERVVLPLVLDQGCTSVVVTASGEFLLGFPRLELIVDDTSIGPFDVPDEGGSWTVEAPLAAGAHRVVLAFENPFKNRNGTRELFDVKLEVR